MAYEDRYGRESSYPPPPPYGPVHNGYHSDDEARRPRASMNSMAARVPSPPPTARRENKYDDDLRALEVDERFRTRSTKYQIPSPPPALRRRRRSMERGSEQHRIPSPTGYSRENRISSLPRQPRISVNQRVPSPPPYKGYDVPVSERTRSPREGNRYRRDFESQVRPVPTISVADGRPFDQQDRPDLIPRRFSRSGADSLALPVVLNSNSAGRPDGVRRWNSERRPNSRVQKGEESDEKAWASKSTSSVPLSNASLASSRSGVLGDRAYQYKPLHDMEFRLVRVFPERRTRIRCEILHASIENPPPYTAISYAWGDAGNTRKIDLEDSLVPISVSLYGALEALRQKTKSVMVWVDALSIDQQNKDERSQQVQLMTGIYSKAESVAMWLGAEEDDSDLAIDLIRSIASQARFPDKVSQLVSSRVGKADLTAIVSLFERDYWRRLWVVQEIFNATSITVYCGTTQVPWDLYKVASHVFGRHRSDLDNAFPGSKRDRRRSTISPNQLSGSQVLVYQGPAGLPDLDTYIGLGEHALLAVLRACRRKITSDAKDKVFGILGCLPEEVRMEFRPDYNLSVKDVYTEVVDYVLKTTERLDVICDAVHFPTHTGSHSLPSYVPDWSHIPQTTTLGHMFNFSASATAKARCRFLDDRLNKLEMSAIYLDEIGLHGVAVGTLCTVSDYLMAFLHWRALILGSLKNDKESDEYGMIVQEAFCKTMSLGQVPPAYSKAGQWLTITYYVFATLLRERLPYLPLDNALLGYLDAKVDIKPDECRQFLQKHYGDRMMGRSFCRTKEGRIGMGAGLMLPGDLVVVPLGCSTPVILRLEGTKGEYRFVGDVYINGYMLGRAVEQWNEGKRELKKYVLH